MSSNIAPRRHLDATTGREVVFCWNCRNEWYRDEQEGLECPRCHGEITEIVSADQAVNNSAIDPTLTSVQITPGEADPREPELPVPAFLLGHQHQEHGSDSDPEEDDIEQHIQHTPHGFFMRRTDPNPDTPRDGTRGPGSPPNANDPHADIMRSFTDMLFTFNGGRPDQPGPNPEGVVPGREDRNVHVAGPHTIQGRTWRSGPFEVAAVSVVIPGSGTGSPGNNGGFGGPPDFNAYVNPHHVPSLDDNEFIIFTNYSTRVFANLLGGQLTPRQGHDDGEPGQQGPVPLPGLPGALGRIFAAYLNPANAVHGDAVFTQEAFDRVITQMMEANPQSNAAPPASQEAISKLESRKLDDKDLGTEGKAECTICIDDMHKGDEVTVLPCKHWFHGECVTLWLKEHNTCPICRSPIEAGNNNNNTGGQQQQSSQDPAPSGPRSPETARSRYGNFRTQVENEDRLNAIRNLGGLGRAYRSYDPNQPTSPSTQGQQQRRSSMSPPPDPSPSREFRSRSRERAGGNNEQRSPMSPPPPMSGYSQQPAEGGRNQDGDDDRRSGNSSREGGNGGPLSWIRDQFSRHSSSGSGNGSGDRRRP